MAVRREFLNLLVVLLAAGLAASCEAQYDYQWRTGRASYYGADA